MGVRVVGAKEPLAGACLYDSVTGFAFGPVFAHASDADDFLLWLEQIEEDDPCDMPLSKLSDLHAHWWSLREESEL